jgi:hypothetical protein
MRITSRVRSCSHPGWSGCGHHHGHRGWASWCGADAREDPGCRPDDETGGGRRRRVGTTDAAVRRRAAAVAAELGIDVDDLFDDAR